PEEGLLERPAEMLFPELESACGIAQNLSRLETCRIVEEPAAARVHQEGVALELEQPERGRPVFRGQRADRVAVEEPADVLLGRVELDLDRVVARRPRIPKEAGRGGLEGRSERVAQPVERFAQRAAPRMARRAPGGASAVV